MQIRYTNLSGAENDDWLDLGYETIVGTTASNSGSLGGVTASAIEAQIAAAQAAADAAIADVDSADATLTADVEAAQADATSALAGVATADANLTTEIGNRQAGDTQNSTSIADLTTTVDGNTSAISDEAITRASADDTLSAEIDTLTSSSGSNDAAITQEAATRASADEALSAEINTVQSNFGALSATVSSDVTALTNAQASTAADITTLTAQTQPNPNLVPDGGLSLHAQGWYLNGYGWTDDPSVGPYIGGGTGGAATFYSPAFSGAPNSSYTMSLDAGGGFPAGQFAIYLVAYDASNVQIGGGFITLQPEGYDGYPRISGAGITPAGTASLRVLGGVNEAVTWSLVKRIKVETGSIATIFSDDATTGALKTAVDASLSSEEVVRASADQALSSSIESLSATVGNNTAAINDNYTTLSDGVSSLASEYNSLDATVAGNTSAINDNYATLTNDLSAQANELNSLTSDYSGLSSTVSENYTTLSNANEAISADVDRLSASSGYAANMVSNSTFALGTADWSIVGGASAGGDGTSEGSFLIFNPGSGTLGVPYEAVAYQALGSISAGESYAIQGRVYCGFVGAPTTFARCVGTWFDAGGNAIEPAVVLWQSDVRQGWTPFKVDAFNGPGAQVAPAGATSYQIVFDMASSAGDLIVTGDNIAINQVQVQQGTICTSWSDTRTGPFLDASITSEALARANGDGALTSQYDTLRI